MASLASGLFKSLPKPKYTGEEEDIPKHAQPRGPRVVGADQLDETQVVLRVSIVSCQVKILQLLILFCIRELDHHHTETEQDGDLAHPKILATAAPFRKF